MRRILNILVFLFALSVRSQTWLDYDQALSRFSWLSTSNAAALTAYEPVDSTQRLISEAVLSISTQHGALVPLHFSPHTWQVGADVRSIYRISGRVVMRGSMDYDNCRGYDAGESVWITPDEMPFDITEYTDSTRGQIRMEQYRLNGELGLNVWQGFSVGTRFAYVSASSSKQKDPRHTNSRMQMDASVGATWNWHGLGLGANYLLRRTTEAVQFSTYGRTDCIYHYLINYGALYGRDEQTDGKGYVSADSEKPLLDMSHGLSIQGRYESGPWSAVGQWTWRHRHGHYGLESPSTIDYNRHNGDHWNATLWLQHARPETIYRLELGWEHENVRDYERTYRTITKEGVTDVVYYDSRLMARRQAINYNVTAVAQWGIHRHLAAWQLEAAVNHHHSDVTAIVYPYYRLQRTHLTTARLSGRRNWLTARDHVWSLKASLEWACGGGWPARDATYGTPSEGMQAPLDHELYLMREYEWLTARRMAVGASIRWSMPLRGGRCRIYVDAGGELQFADDIHYLENSHRHRATVSLGCLF